jgi:hypothetical protein
MPPTGAEFVQHVIAGLQTGAGQAPQPAVPPSNPPQPAPVAHPFRGEAFRSAPTQPRSPIPAQAPPTPAVAPSPTSAPAPQTPAAHFTPSSPVCHPARSEGSHPFPSPPFAPSAAPTAQPDNPPQTAPSTPQPALNRDPYAIHFDHNYRLLVDGKPF